MLVLVRYVLTAALRDKLVLFLCAAFVFALSLSLFLGSSAVSERVQFSLVFAASSMRMACVAILVLFICSCVRRMYDARDIDFLLSAPLSRTRMIISFALAFLVLAVSMALMQGACLWALFFRAPIETAYGIWTLGLMAELALMAMTALFFSMVLSSVTAATMASFAYYILGRLIGQLLGIVAAGADLHIFKILGAIMNLISIIVPRFDLMGQTTWLVYGVDDITAILPLMRTQFFVFSGLLITATAIDFQRRKF